MTCHAQGSIREGTISMSDGAIISSMSSHVWYLLLSLYLCLCVLYPKQEFQAGDQKLLF